MPEGRAAGGGSAPLRQQVARGAAAIMGGQVLRIVLQLGTLVVLARLLPPREFGLVAGVLALVGVAEVLRVFGLSTAGMRAESLSVAERDALFYGNAVIGVVFALVVVAVAPLIGHLYGEQQLVPVARVLAIAFAVNGLAAQYRVDLSRRLQFSYLAAVDVLAQVIGLVLAVLLAVRGAGHWALVVQQVSQAVSALVLVALACGWLPGPPTRLGALRPFLRFGGTVMASQVVTYVSKNVDNVLVGARVGLVDLGVYSRAYSFLMTPLGQLRSPTTNVALPALARLHDDQARYDDFLRRGQLALGYVLVGMLAVASGTARPLVEVVLGAQWSGATPLVRLLAYAGALETLPYVAYWVYVSRGLAPALLRYTLLSSVLRVTCIAVGSSYGAVGVAAGFVVGTAVNWPLSLWSVARVTTMDAGQLVRQGCRLLALALVTTGGCSMVVALSDDLPDLLQLVLGVATGLGVYLLGALLLLPVRRDLVELAELARALRSRRTGSAGGPEAAVPPAGGVPSAPHSPDLQASEQ